jgi:uncharacterized membrane protein
MSEVVAKRNPGNKPSLVYWAYLVILFAGWIATFSTGNLKFVYIPGSIGSLLLCFYDYYVKNLRPSKPGISLFGTN